MTPIEKQTRIFESVPIKKAVLFQVFPAIISQIISLIYNMADTYFVGMLNSPAQTGALTIATMPFIFLTAISNLFGVGGASAISRALGKKDSLKAKRISSISFWCGVIISVFFCSLIYIFLTPILTLCGAKEQTLPYAYGYAKWVVVYGGAFNVLNLLLANLIRAEGKALIASVGVSLGGIINIILDPYLILPEFLNLGAEGAGIATAISNLIATLFLLSYIIIVRKSTVIKIAVKDLKYFTNYAKEILSIGLPSALQYSLTVIAASFHTSFVANYDEFALAGYSIVKKLDQIPLFVSIGIANAILPLLAYNYASKNYERRSQAFKFGTMLSVGFAVFCVILYELFPNFLVGLFIKDQTTIEYGSNMLKIMVLAMPFIAVNFPIITQFQAMGKGRESLICSIMRRGVLDIPLLFLMKWLFSSVYAVVSVQLIVDLITVFIGFIIYFKVQKKEKLKLLNENKE